MTKDETMQAIKILKIAYPNSYKDYTSDEAAILADLWYDALKEYPSDLVMAAVKSIIYGDTREFAPNIGQVRAKVSELSQLETETADEAWLHVKKALRNGIYGYTEEFEKLPALCKIVVGEARQIHEWAKQESSVVDSVIASNFKRSYRELVESEFRKKAIPSDVRNAFGIETKEETTDITRLPNGLTESEARDFNNLIARTIQEDTDQEATTDEAKQRN